MVQVRALKEADAAMNPPKVPTIPQPGWTLSHSGSWLPDLPTCPYSQHPGSWPQLPEAFQAHGHLT